MALFIDRVAKRIGFRARVVLFGLPAVPWILCGVRMTLRDGRAALVKACASDSDCRSTICAMPVGS
jgi:hypothetical protein